MSFWNRILGRKGESQEPEKKQLEGSALVGTNVLDLGPWKQEPPDEKRLGNLVFWSLRTPIIDGREPMVVDRIGRYIYCGHSLYRFDFEGNPKGRLRLDRGPYGGLAVSHDGKVLVSSGQWLYRVDGEGQVISAVQSTWFDSIDVLPNGTIVGVRDYRTGGIDKTILGLVQGEKVHEVDVSATMVYGHDVRSSPDGFLYVVGGPASTTFVGNTVFKLDPLGHLVNSCSIFRNIGAICPTREGGIDVLEIDGSRLVRLSREMKVVYDSQRDSRPEVVLLFQMNGRGLTLLNYVQALDTDDAGNFYVLAHGVLTRSRQFWAEPLRREAKGHSEDKGELLKSKRDVEGLIEALEDENRSIDRRMDAAQALGEIKDARAVEPLIEALSSESPGMRWAAAKTLGEIGDRRSIEPLARAYRNYGDDRYTRYYAVIALGQFKDDERSLKALEEVLRDPEPDLRRIAAIALGKIR